MDLKTYTHNPASGKAPQQLVIFLHGWGANGRDLIDLGSQFAPVLPEAQFVSPDAPFPCDASPVGFQWFSLESWSPETVLRGVHAAAPILDTFISGQMEKYNVPAERTALVGFSQGTMMSLYVGPRFPEKLAGVLGYSGALIWEDGPELETALNRIPVCLVHGGADEVVPVDAYHHARQVLEALDFPVSGGVTPGLGHFIDEAGLRTGADFLKKVFS